MSQNQEYDYEEDEMNEDNGEDQYENDEKMNHENQNQQQQEQEGTNKEGINQTSEGSNYYDKISYELVEKLKVLGEYIKDKNEEEALNIRMYQLAICKILVFTHNQSQSILVKGHTQIGEAYLNYKCYEQAIDHLTIALKKNGKLMVGEEEGEVQDEAEKKNCTIYHAKILTLLGKCYLEIGAFDDSYELLEKALDLYKTYTDHSNYQVIEVETIDTLVLISQCLASQTKFQEAINQINKAFKLSSKHFNNKSIQTAMVIIEISKIHAKQDNHQQAIQELQQAIEYLDDLNYDKPEFIAELYQNLADYQEKINDQDAFLNSLEKVRDIYIQINGPSDKKVIKIKRQISINLLKNERHNEALNELLQTEEMESRVYGEYSVQVAKTHKIIGTILILNSEYIGAQKYLNKALKIFQENGLKKQVAEIKNKLKLAKDIKEKMTNKNNNQDNNIEDNII